MSNSDVTRSSGIFLKSTALFFLSLAFLSVLTVFGEGEAALKAQLRRQSNTSHRKKLNYRKVS